jgi:hypothetical protein
MSLNQIKVFISSVLFGTEVSLRGFMLKFLWLSPVLVKVETSLRIDAGAGVSDFS